MAASSARHAADDRAEYLWFLENGFRWPTKFEDRAELYPACEYEIRQLAEHLSEESRATARYDAARREALFEIALPEARRIQELIADALDDEDEDEEHEPS